jgi:hypothetical protein
MGEIVAGALLRPVGGTSLADSLRGAGARAWAFPDLIASGRALQPFVLAHCLHANRPPLRLNML